MSNTPALAILAIGENSTPLWGMSARERLRRIAVQNKLVFTGPNEDRPAILANLAFAFDPVWIPWLKGHPGSVVTRDGIPVLAHCVSAAQREKIERAMIANAATISGSGLAFHPAEDPAGIYNDALRKRERPFAEALVPATVDEIERASYSGAYKGVTDLLTKYLWPTWAFHLTRLAAWAGLSPNGVTAIGTVLCIVATIAFWYGCFWSGLAIGFVFMVLDTVDGKLARCTITSSALGNAWDHGIDLVHPPIWWWVWAGGCAAYGRPLDDTTFWIVIATMFTGYVAQRIIEGAFIAGFGMHIHVWRKFDSAFRLVTARRNPNMLILFLAMLIARPDWGIIAVAAWTALSLVVHLLRLIQAFLLRKSGRAVISWLA